MNPTQKPALGRLEKVKLRDIWTSEPYDFTPWLAQEENLKLLGEALQLDLTLIQSEKLVGSFSCDILAKDAFTDHFVVIENQLEGTDHIHLGQLVTYAAGLDASTVVWVARFMREEHRQALDWLNSKTSDELSFFGVEVELWRIGESAVAPKFSIVAKPNTYQKAVRQSKENASATSSAGQAYLSFFTALKDHLGETAPQLRTMKPSPDSWTNISLGRSGIHLCVEVSQQKKYVEVKLYVQNDMEKITANYLEELMPSLQSIIPEAKLDRNEGKKHTSVDVVLPADPTNESERNKQLSWIAHHILLLDKFFRPIVKDFPVT